MSGSISPGTLVGAGGDGGGAPSPPPAHGDDAAGDERPMTYDEKRTLSLGINMLNGSLLGRVIQIIQSMQPGTGDDDTNEFEIDFEKLNPSTLRALERFVKSKVPYVYEQQHSDHDDEL